MKIDTSYFHIDWADYEGQPVLVAARLRGVGPYRPDEQTVRAAGAIPEGAYRDVPYVDTTKRQFDPPVALVHIGTSWSQFGGDEGTRCIPHVTVLGLTPYAGLGASSYAKTVHSATLFEAGVVEPSGMMPPHRTSIDHEVPYLNHAPTLEEARAAFEVVRGYLPEAVRAAATYLDDVSAAQERVFAAHDEIPYRADRAAYEALCARYDVETVSDAGILEKDYALQFGEFFPPRYDAAHCIWIATMRARYRMLTHGVKERPLLVQIVEVLPEGHRGQQTNLTLVGYLRLSLLDELDPVWIEADVPTSAPVRVPQDIAAQGGQVDEAVTAFLKTHRPDLVARLSRARDEPGYTWSAYLAEPVVCAVGFEPSDALSRHRAYVREAVEEAARQKRTNVSGVERRPCYSCGLVYERREVERRGGDWEGNPFDPGTCYCGC